MDIDTALSTFEVVEVNVERLQSVWDGIEGLVPSHISFFGPGDLARIEYDERCRSFDAIASACPPINEFVISARPVPLNDIAQSRLDAHETGEFEIELALEEARQQPAAEIAEYRRRLRKARRQLVRDHVTALLAEADTSLRNLTGRYARTSDEVSDEDWTHFVAAFAEITRLLGSDVHRKGRWNELTRHAWFGQAVDVNDVIEHDWPSVRTDIEAALYTEFEPLPVPAVADLATLARSSPTGRVTTQLDWSGLTEDDFERLVYDLVRTTPSYENAQWLMHVNAPDRGRDVSVERVRSDLWAESVASVL